MNTENNNTDPTPAQLLTAAREGKITATVIDSETLPPLAGGDGPEQYPSCTIALQVDTGEPDLRSIIALPGVTGATALPDSRKIIVAYMTSAAEGLLPLLPGKILDASNNAGLGSDVIIELGKDIPTRRTTIREIRAWKLVYYSTDGDALNGGRGTYDFRAVSSDQATRGDATVTREIDTTTTAPIDRVKAESIEFLLITEGILFRGDKGQFTRTGKIGTGVRKEVTEERIEGILAEYIEQVEISIDDSDGSPYLSVRWVAHPEVIEIETGVGCTSVESIDITGLTEEEAEEVREAIADAIDDAYEGWEPDHPDQEEIYAALVAKKKHTTSIDAEVAGEDISVMLYAGTHCGQPQFAFAGDENARVYESAEDCATEARGKLEELFDTAKEKLTTVEAIITEAGNGFPSDGGLVYDSTGNTVYEVVRTGRIETGRSSGAGNWVTATLKEAEESDPTDYSQEAWEEVSDCRVDIDEDGPKLDTAALDKQEREAADALTASQKEEE